MDWFRAYSEMIRDPKLRRLAKEMGCSLAKAIGIWTCLLALANESPVRGELRLSARVPLSDADLAESTGVEEISQWLARMKQLDMLTRERGAWIISKWNKRQFVSDNVTERTRKYRRERSRNVPGTHQIQSQIQNTETESKNIGAAQSPRPRDPLWDAIVEVTGASTKRMAASVGKVKKALLEESPPYTPEEVREFGQWYAHHHPVNRVPTVWKLISEIGIIRSPNGQFPAQSRSEPVSEARRRGEAIRRTLTHVDVSGFRTAPTAGELGLVPGVPGSEVAPPRPSDH